MKTKNTWFVYTAEISGNRETLIASELTQFEAQELCEEYRRNLERNCSNEYASYDEINGSSVAKRLGLK